MKLRAVIVAAVLFGSVVEAAETGIEFAGVLTAGGKTRIALTDKAKKTTTWVEPGDQFNGFTVVRYDPKEEAVFLTKGGTETRIGLVTSRTPDVPPSPINNASAQTTTTAIRANLRQLASAARQLQAQRGVSMVSYADLVGPDKLIKEIKPLAGENYSTLSFGQNVTGVSVTTANGTTIGLELPSTGVAGSVTPAAPAPGGPPAAPTALVSATSSAVTAPTSPGALATTQDTATPGLSPTGYASSGGPTSTASAVAPAPAPTESIPPVDPTQPATPLQPTGRQPVSPSYMIQGGDTWERISVGTGVPVQQLKQMNPTILEGSALPAGQTIRVR